ncbi:dihydroneopterin aldolase [Blattabacterium cuenoti]|uniref:dihydroneopterin aldolase n=1 Tax=Blattabacterium cuenoti TaxID=1653831 RepID=UPI00163BBDB5|nr:dihydroneopterin aldolase [Blattabacterium cuenoti]
MGKILIENLRLFGFHGCMPEESLIGSHYTINLEIELDLNKASISDDLSQTVNYVDLYRIVKKEMSIRSKLIEHLAKRIVKKIKEHKKDSIKSTKIKICKENPPLKNMVDRVCIILEE